MEIRFAAIPKCASRSLKALGLLGELEGRCHTQVTEYPDWQKYRWFAVDRPEGEWLESWWRECQRTKSMFADWLGFKYENLADDLALLGNPPATPAPRRWGLNQWVPDNFTADYLTSGLRFKDYCFAKVTDGVPCELVMLEDLNAWLIAHGFNPVHMNERDANALC